MSFTSLDVIPRRTLRWNYKKKYFLMETLEGEDARKFKQGE
jgi:hypothetical protein